MSFGEPPHIPKLLAEVERFRSWAETYPSNQRSGEWECNYEQWNRLHAVVLEFVDRKAFESWSADELSAVLYTIARDNETEYVAREMRERGDALLLGLAEESLRIGEPHAKWQLATQLEHVRTDLSRREDLLRAFAQDDAEYVRRRALQTLARIGSPATERLALEAWARPDESQQWSRMMALWTLHHIRSPQLEPLLAEAEREGQPYLSEYAAKVRSGDVDM